MERNIFKETVTLLATSVPRSFVPAAAMIMATKLNGEREYCEFMEALAVSRELCCNEERRDYIKAIEGMADAFWACERSRDEAKRTYFAVEKYISANPMGDSKNIINHYA